MSGTTVCGKAPPQSLNTTASSGSTGQSSIGNLGAMGGPGDGAVGGLRLWCRPEQRVMLGTAGRSSKLPDGVPARWSSMSDIGDWRRAGPLALDV